MAIPRINEFVFNHVGADSNEFIEIFGDPNTDLSRFSLIVIEGDGTNAGTIDRVFPVGTTNAAGFWTTAFLGNGLENGTNSVLLVEDFSGAAGGDLDSDNDGNLDAAPWSSIVDSVAVSDGGTGDLAYGSTVLLRGFDGNSNTVGGASRIPDGTDTDTPADWVRNDFDGAGLPDFPGAAAEVGEAVNTPGTENRVATTPPPPPPPADIVINETDADQPGADSAEFIELFDGGAGNTALDGLTLVLFNGSNDQSYRAFDLDGFSTDAEGYFLLGNASVGPDILFTGLQNGADAVALYAGDAADFPNGTAPTMDNLIDAIVYGTNDPVAAGLLAALGQTTQYNETGTGSIGRDPNGTGDFVTLERPTPGTANDAPPPPPPSVAIYDIQGAGHRSPLDGQTIATVGIVTAVDSNGFYLQDATGDGDIATSDGIFVFTGTAPSVLVGDEVEVVGAVQERQFSPDLSLTQLTGVSSVTLLTSGNAVPDAVVLGAGGRQPPTEVIDDDGLTSFDPVLDGIDFFESLEGMLVTVPDATVVAGTNRFNEIWTLADNGIAASGVNDRGGITIAPDDFNPERIQIQIDSTLTPGGAPQVDVGDSLGDVTGVVGYSFGNFEVLATEALTPSDGGLAPETTALESGTADRLSMASFNVLNLDPNDADGDQDIANGRFAALGLQIAENLKAPDIVALQEVQDNSGSVNDGVVDASLTYQTLIDAIAAAGGPQYAFFEIPPEDGQDGGQPGGNIRVGYLYNPERVALDPDSAQRLLDPDLSDGDAFAATRKSLAVTFLFNGQEVQVVNNHWSSKGGSSSLFGEIQPPINGREALREAQAQIVNDHVDEILAADPDANVVVLGDLNEFDFFSPLEVLRGGADPVLTDLADSVEQRERYSFIFQGNAQALDHILVGGGLDRPGVAQFDFVHVNTEFAGQASDHDPLVALFTFGDDQLLFTDGNDDTRSQRFRDVDFSGDDILFAFGGDDKVFAASGNDLVRGGEGNDKLFGGRGDDELFGGNGDDKLFGSYDNDRLFGEAGDDLLHGGRGNDQMVGGDGNDWLAGGRGDDELNGGAGNDKLFGNYDNDRLFGEAGDDFLHGGRGDDELFGGDGNDRITGNRGDDKLNGGDGDDLLYAGRGFDELSGGDGRDHLFGNRGNDVLAGGAGDDFLTGGPGLDTFIFDGGHDVITDFRPGDDDDDGSGEILDLSAFGITDLQQAAPLMAEDDDNTVIRFDAENSVTLVGVEREDLLGDDDHGLF